MNKVQTILYSDKMGEGLILNENDPKPFRRESTTVAGHTLVPGEASDLAGYFTMPLIFCGIINKSSLVFLLGFESDLFGTKHYYQVIHKISETRLFSMFTYDAGRDFNYVNQKWK